MSTAPIIADLGMVEFINGVNDKHEGFITIRAVSADGNISLIGQMSPEQTQQHGHDAIEAAVHATYEASLMKACHVLFSESPDTADQMAAALVGIMREANT